MVKNTIKIKWKFEDCTRKIFPYVEEYNESASTGTVYFRVKDEFDAEGLFLLSDLLGVRSILCRSGCEDSLSGCPTCGSDITKYIEISVTGVNFKEIF